VLVSAGNVGVSQILGESLEDSDVSLRWGVTLNVRPLRKVFFKLGKIDWHVGRSEAMRDEGD